MGMEECEICGTKTNSIYVVNVEDVELRVCVKCAKGKKVLRTIDDTAKKPSFKSSREAKKEEAQLIENYGNVMHSARESMKIPLKVLAEMLNEKETLLLRIEQQKTMPAVELTKKLEKALNIKLTEEAKEVNVSFGGGGDKVTLEDFIKKKK
jgi:putative transcription factor